MHCINCGTQLQDGMKFCIACGAAQPDPAQVQQPPAQQPVQTNQKPQAQDYGQNYQPDHSYTPQPPTKKSKKPLIITLIIVAVIAVLAAAAVFVLPMLLGSSHSVEKAKEYLKAENFTAAIAEYEAVIEDDPDNNEAYLGLGKVYEKMAASGEKDIADVMNEIEELINEVSDEKTKDKLSDILDDLAEMVEEEDEVSRPADTTKDEPSEVIPAEPETLQLSDISGIWGTSGYSVKGKEYSEPINLSITDGSVIFEDLDSSITVHADEMEFSEDSFTFYYDSYKFTYTYNSYSNTIEGKRESLTGEIAYMYFSYGAVDLIQPEGHVLNIWCWNDEFKQRVTAFYPGYIDYGDDTGKIGDVKVNWIINANVDNGYQIPLDAALADQYNVAADEKIDIFLIEGDYAYKYVNSEYTLPLYSVGINGEDTSEMYPYTIQIGTDTSGALKAASWQATPGVFAYRRSIAKQVLGTDDPDAVQQYLSDWDKFDETARRMKANGYYMLSGYDDACRASYNNLSSPWVNEDNQIIIDENILRWVQQTKTYTDNGYNNKSSLWSDQWCADQGPDSKVFGFFYSTWGVNFTLIWNADYEGYGDWAICEGPAPYYWGGSWICAAYQTDNKSLVRDIIYQLCCNSDIMYEMATDPETLDYTNNMAAIERAIDSGFSSDFLGGQNPFEVFHEAAKKVDMSSITPYDLLMTDILQMAFRDYFDGKIDFDTALDSFYTNVTARYPQLQYEH